VVLYSHLRSTGGLHQSLLATLELPSVGPLPMIAGTFDIASDAQVILVGGALASNIFWVVTGAVTVHPGAHFEGVILAKTGVTLQTGATMNGRILSQTLVALQSATVVG